MNRVSGDYNVKEIFEPMHLHSFFLSHFEGNRHRIIAKNIFIDFDRKLWYLLWFHLLTSVVSILIKTFGIQLASYCMSLLADWFIYLHAG